MLTFGAYGFCDPLFSRGMWRSLESLDTIVDTVMAALEDDELARIFPLEQEKAQHAVHERLIKIDARQPGFRVRFKIETEQI